RMLRLPPRLTTTAHSQWLRTGFGERRVRRRRPRRVPAVLSQLPPQVRNFSLELLDPLGLPHDKLGELLVRRTTGSRHPTMITNLARRSTHHAGRPDQSRTSILSTRRSRWQARIAFPKSGSRRPRVAR